MEIYDVMQSLGFTKYEIAIMLKLYEYGPSKADALKDIDISLSRVYDALEILRRKNFIKVTSGRPRIYEAIKPQIAVKALIDAEKNKQEQIINNYSQMATKFLDHAQTLYYSTHTEIAPDDLMTQYHTLNEAEEKTVNLIKSAQKSIIIFTHVFHWFDAVKDDLQHAIDRGVRVKVLLQGKNNSKTITTLKKMDIDIKILDDVQLFTRGTIVDDQSVLFIIWVEEEKQGGRKIYRPQFSTNTGIVNVFKMCFNFLWF